MRFIIEMFMENPFVTLSNSKGFLVSMSIDKFMTFNCCRSIIRAENNAGHRVTVNFTK